MKKKKIKDNSNTKVQNKFGYLFLAPWLIGFMVFTCIPLFYTAYLSFFDVKLTVLGWERSYIGVGNYVTALLRNLEFGPNLVQFLIMEVVYAPTIVIVSFILALLLNQNIKFRAGLRVIYFLPVIVLSGSVMLQLMDSGSTQMGMVEDVLIYKMIEAFSPYLASVIQFLFTNFTMVLWFTGIPIILFINGIQKIDRSLMEAAQIDGAHAWQRLWKITIPIVQPIALVSVIFTIVQLGLFPLNPVYSMIQEAIFNTAGGLGLASAYAWVYSLLVLLLIGVAFMFLRDKHNNAEN